MHVSGCERWCEQRMCAITLLLNSCLPKYYVRYYQYAPDTARQQ